MNPDEFQRLANEPRPGDDNPVAMTATRTEKCAAIVRAVEEGHALYRVWIPGIVGYLTNSAYLARHPDNTQVAAEVDDLAQQLDDAPWPQIGPPRNQPK